MASIQRDRPKSYPTRHCRLWAAVLQAAVLACLVPFPATATIIQAGKTQAETARLKALAHEAGRQQKSVVGIILQKDNWPSDHLVRATGVYLGLAKDGTTGLVLTSAHQWFEETTPGQPGHLKAVTVAFGPRNAAGAETITGYATRVNIHPDYRSAADDSGLPRSIQPEIGKTDLAILEFPVDGDLERNLQKYAIQAAHLYDGAGYKQSLREAQIAGFGLFGTNQSEDFHNRRDRRIYGGQTRVTYSTFRGRAGFYHWSAYAPEGVKRLFPTDPSLNSEQFSMDLQEKQYYDPFDNRLIPVQSHPNQALFAGGDSGGPLLFTTRKGIRVAGIASYTAGCKLLVPGTKTEAFVIRQMWEPVKPHKAWIEAVTNGNRTTSLVWAVGLPGHETP